MSTIVIVSIHKYHKIIIKNPKINTIKTYDESSNSSANVGKSYDENFKKGFYDALIPSMFSSMENTLISRGFTKESVKIYSYTMQSRLNRTKLENETWDCVSTYSPDQMINKPTDIYEKCFSKWSNSFFFEENSDATSLLKR